jgi:enoyl-CoA hydratase
VSALRVERLQDGQIVRLSLASGRGNPLTPELLRQLRQAVSALSEAPPRAVILDGGGSSIFSGGFSLPHIARWDRVQINAFFDDFMDCIYGLLELPSPVVAGIAGHAIAGGFILSLAADFRIVSEAGVRLGLSEVDLGVAVPAGTLALLVSRVGSPAALRMSAGGLLVVPQVARQIGFADELAADAEERALALAQRLSAKPGNGVGITTQLFNRPVVAAMRAAEADGREEFLDSWFSEEAQAALHALSDRLSGKRRR